MVSKEKLLKEKTQIKELLSRTESSYRTAQLSEKRYNETKSRLLKKLEDIESRIELNGDAVSGEKAAMKPETEKSPEDAGEEKNTEKPKKPRVPGARKKKPDAQPLPAAQPEAPAPDQKVPAPDAPQASPEQPKPAADATPKTSPANPEEPKREEKKKEEKKEDNSAGDFTAEAAAQFGPQEEVADVQPAAQKEDLKLELEKLKVLVDGMREEKKAVQESLQNISESMGELRSMIFQSEGLSKELEMKEEKVQEEISEIRPSEISKRLRKFDENFERFQIYTDKSDAKFDDLSKKVNTVYDMLKSAGSIENLSEINRQISKKLEDFNDAMKYVERLATKTEKAFLEVNKNLDDFHVYKARQDNLEEAFKDMSRGIDEINLKMDESATKKDFSSFSGEIMILRKQMEEVQRLVPLLKVKIPEPIEKLGKDKEEIKAMLEMLDSQQASGTISKQEYDKLKKANENKLKKTEDAIDNEWKRIEKFIEDGGDLGGEPLPVPTEAAVAPEESRQPSVQEKPAESSQAEQKKAEEPDTQKPTAALPQKSVPEEKREAPVIQQASSGPANPMQQLPVANDMLKREIEEIIKSQMKALEERLSIISASKPDAPEEDKYSKRLENELSGSNEDAGSIEEELEEEVSRVFQEQSVVDEIPLLEEPSEEPLPAIEEPIPAAPKTEHKQNSRKRAKETQPKLLPPAVPAAEDSKKPAANEPTKPAEATNDIAMPENAQSPKLQGTMNIPESTVNTEDRNQQPMTNTDSHPQVTGQKKSSVADNEPGRHESIISRFFHHPHDEMKKEAEELKKLVTARRNIKKPIKPDGEIGTQISEASSSATSSGEEAQKAVNASESNAGKEGTLERILHIAEHKEHSPTVPKAKDPEVPDVSESRDDVISLIDKMEKEDASPEKTAILERLKKAAEEADAAGGDEKQKGKAFEIAKKIKEMM